VTRRLVEDGLSVSYEMVRARGRMLEIVHHIRTGPQGGPFGNASRIAIITVQSL
jgi:hypothetical protein